MCLSATIYLPWRNVCFIQIFCLFIFITALLKCNSNAMFFTQLNYNSMVLVFLQYHLHQFWNIYHHFTKKP
jgi:hypothetical protein